MIGEQGSCFISETRIIKERLDTHETDLSEQADQGESGWTQKGRPNARRRTRVSQPRVRYNFERGGRSVYDPLKLRSNV